MTDRKYPDDDPFPGLTGSSHTDLRAIEEWFNRHPDEKASRHKERILSWQPTPTLRFREAGDHGMLLEQQFVCITMGEGNRTEWRPVPVVPESERP